MLPTKRKCGFEKSEGAFTLLEVLFASVLMVIVAAIVLYLSNTVLTTWQSSTEGLSLDSETDLVLDYLAQDLSSAFFRNDGQTWLMSDQSLSGQTVENTLWLRFFTSASDRDRTRPGDLNAVSYRLLPIEPLGGSTTIEGLSSLYRSIKEADETFQLIQGNLENIEEVDFLDFSDSQALQQSFLLGDIISFNVRYFIRVPKLNGGWEEREIAGQNIRFPHPSALKPAFIEISLTVLSPDAARHIDAAAEGLDPSLNVTEFIASSGKTVTRRIVLLGGAF